MKNTNNPAPIVGKFYQWEGPKNSFYMGQCTAVQGASIHFDNGPAMLDDGRYRETSPARSVAIPVYTMAETEGARA